MIVPNVYYKELKQNRTSFIGWSIAVNSLILLGMVFYPVLMEGDVLKQMTSFFETPVMKNIMTAFGTNLEKMTNILGYYVSRNASLMMLLGSVFSIMLASKILSREEREKTAEFLLAKPITRLEVAASKFAAFFTYLVLLNLITVLAGFIGMEVFKGDSVYSISAFLTHSFYAFLLMLTFGAIGFFLSVLIKRGRSISNVSIGIVFGGYFFDVLSKMTKSADKFGYISPFKFVDSNVLMPGYGLEWWRLLYFLTLSLGFIAMSFFIYRKKDILV